MGEGGDVAPGHSPVKVSISPKMRRKSEGVWDQNLGEAGGGCNLEILPTPTSPWRLVWCPAELGLPLVAIAIHGQMLPASVSPSTLNIVM